MKNWKMNLVVMLGMGIGVASCSHSSWLTAVDFISTESDVELTNSEGSIDDEVDAVSFNSKGMEATALQERLPAGATIDDTGKDAFPRALTIDFGDGVEDRKKCRKKGQIIVEMSEDMAVIGAKRTTTFKDFSVKGRQITGTKVMTTVSVSAEGQPEFLVETNLTMIDKKGTTITKIATGTNTWRAGFGDDDRFNDVFVMKGTATVEVNNEVMTRTVVEPLLVDRSCEYIKQGIVELDKNGMISSIDFGDGNCDAIATVTKDGDTYEIDLEEERVDHGKGKCNKEVPTTSDDIAQNNS